MSADEFQRNTGVYQDMALTNPVAITKDGQERTVLLSSQEYHRLKRRDRQVLGLGDLTENDIAAIAGAKVDPKYNHLDDELKDWQP
ncbi:MAG TPA: hypothetical protein VGF56_02535 [Rhizomicrobium sp.]